MKTRILSIAAAAIAWLAMHPNGQPADAPARIAIDYPEEGTIFPPDFTAPTFLWRDAAANANVWRIDIEFADGSAPVRVTSAGEPLRVGEIDPRCVANTNQFPSLTPQQAGTRTWKPDPRTWAAIRSHSVEHPAVVNIGGYDGKGSRMPVSHGQVGIETSRDPVGAPIFYRDVPLMPSELERGVIKPLAPKAVPLIAWRLRNVSEPASRLVMEGLPTCANCHSFSRDGKKMGMDVDGPENDKGVYAIVPVKPQTSIRTQDVITWNSFSGKPPGGRTTGFLAQVSPDGRYAAVTLNEEVYVANFKDYRFLQVFYPTRGILAWYDCATRRMQSLPGADDPRYVQTDGVWSPDGKYLIFARAEARDAYPAGRKPAEFANDPNETPIQYDLYRVPFNGGTGGRAEPVAGASRNGMSNSFPKISPDGRWIVFVQCRNGQLMRPDSQLYIVSAGGGKARRMRANTGLMNSWHSFSPNGRWLVFSSKSRSPYTQMFLTHLDGEGRDSPPILIENATAGNRAVNLPEFVNIPPDGLIRITAPAADFYRLFDRALELTEKGQDEAAIAEWEKALALDGENAKAHNNLGVLLTRKGRFDEALAHFRKATELKPDDAQSHFNLGRVLWRKGRGEQAKAEWRKSIASNPALTDAYNALAAALASEGIWDEAVAAWQRAAETDGGDAEIQDNLGVALARLGKLDEAVARLRKAVELKPDFAQAHYNLGVALAKAGQYDAGIVELERALELTPDNVEAHYSLGKTLYVLGRVQEAMVHWRSTLRLAPENLPALNQTAWALATSPERSVRNGPEAVRLGERALELSGGRQPEVLDTLAAAYAEAGRFGEAVRTASRALAIAVEQNNQGLVEALNARIRLYESNTPYREN